MNDPSAPPPNYGAAVDANSQSFPQPGMTSARPMPQDPPPKYEPPKSQEYNDQAQYGYQAQPTYPVSGAVTQTIIVQQPGFGPEPGAVDCPNCRAFVTTHTQHVAGALTWLSAGIICLFGCWMGCCLIPFCINDLQDVEHRCPNCGRVIGTYARL